MPITKLLFLCIGTYIHRYTYVRTHMHGGCYARTIRTPKVSFLLSLIQQHQQDYYNTNSNYNTNNVLAVRV